MIKAKCQFCGKAWGISVLQKIPKSGYICPKCGRRTVMHQHRIDAVNDWNTGDTYVPKKESDRLPDEYEKIKNQRIIRRW